MHDSKKRKGAARANNHMLYVKDERVRQTDIGSTLELESRATDRLVNKGSMVSAKLIQQREPEEELIESIAPHSSKRLGNSSSYLPL